MKTNESGLDRTSAPYLVSLIRLYFTASFQAVGHRLHRPRRRHPFDRVVGFCPLITIENQHNKS